MKKKLSSSTRLFPPRGSHALILFLLAAFALLPVAGRTQDNLKKEREELARLSARHSLTPRDLLRRGQLQTLCRNDSRAALADARAALQDPKIQEAGTLLDSKTKPTTDTVATYLGALHLAAEAASDLGQTQEAIGYYQAILQATDTDYYALWNDMVLQAYAKNWPAAESDARALVQVPGGDNFENRLILARSLRYGTAGPDAAIPEYVNALHDPYERTPLVVYVELAETYLQLSTPDCANSIATYQAAINRLTSRDGTDASFPPEWRIRMAEIMKAAAQPGWQSHATRAIADVDKYQALTKPSAVLYALRADAAELLGNTLQARSDAFHSAQIWNQLNPDNTITYTQQSTQDILAFILGSDHLDLTPVPPCGG